MLFGCYQTGRQTHDSDTYVAAIAATLSRFSPLIVTAATRPEGIPAKIAWVPSVKEVFDYCTAEQAAISARETRRARINEQLEARAADDAKPKPTLEELQAKYGKDWGLDPTGGGQKGPRTAWRAPTWDKIAEMYQAEPGRITHLADALKRLRGEVT